MIWNWQQPDWPTFQWDQVRLEVAEKQFLVNGGVFVGTVRHLGTEERDQLTIEAMSTEAVTTSEIEGESWIGRACSPLSASNWDWLRPNDGCGQRSEELLR